MFFFSKGTYKKLYISTLKFRYVIPQNVSISYHNNTNLWLILKSLCASVSILLYYLKITFRCLSKILYNIYLFRHFSPGHLPVFSVLYRDSFVFSS